MSLDLWYHSTGTPRDTAASHCNATWLWGGRDLQDHRVPILMKHTAIKSGQKAAGRRCALLLLSPKSASESPTMGMKAVQCAMRWAHPCHCQHPASLHLLTAQQCQCTEQMACRGMGDCSTLISGAINQTLTQSGQPSSFQMCSAGG